MQSIRRRLISLAGSSFVVSLPKKWVKLHNLKGKDSINLVVDDNKIIISPEEGIKELSKEVDISSLDKQMIELVIVAYYRAGYSEIKLAFSNTTCSDLKSGGRVKIMKVVRSTVSKLIGVEVVKQTDHSCIIKEVVSSDASEFDNLIRRIFLLLLDYSNLSLSLLGESKRNSNLDEFSVDFETAERLVNYCLRLLRRSGYKVYDRALFLYSYLNVVEELLSDYHFLINSVNSLKLSKSERSRIAKILNKANNLVRGMYSLFYDFTFDKVNELYTSRREIFSAINKAKRISKFKNTLLVVDLIGVITNLTLKLVDLRLEMQA